VTGQPPGVVDVGYRDPMDEPDVDRDDTAAPGPDDLTQDQPAPPLLTPIGELSPAQLERELAFGNGIRQVLARDELERRASGYQPALFGPLVARSR
jgi:hypothetical protein